jgi:hypothetical protein
VVSMGSCGRLPAKMTGNSRSFGLATHARVEAGDCVSRKGTVMKAVAAAHQ